MDVLQLGLGKLHFNSALSGLKAYGHSTLLSVVQALRSKRLSLLKLLCYSKLAKFREYNKVAYLLFEVNFLETGPFGLCTFHFSISAADD